MKNTLVFGAFCMGIVVGMIYGAMLMYGHMLRVFNG